MGGLQPAHLIIILVIALIIFGPQRLPELAKALGQSIAEFKKGTAEALGPAEGSTTSAGHASRGDHDAASAASVASPRPAVDADPAATPAGDCT